MMYSPLPPFEQQYGEDYITIDLGQVSRAELQWWSNILAPGQLWRAERPEQPVWAVAYKGNVKFHVRGQEGQEIAEAIPPSSALAVQWLSRFAARYDVQPQVQLALSMALTIPLHGVTNTTIQLPRPVLASPEDRWEEDGCAQVLYDCLPRYMTLSSNARFMFSAFWGTFWEPDVYCNLVTAWCDPIVQVLEPLIERGSLETLGHVLALRCPKLAALWYGLLACGQTRTVESIVPFLKSLQTPSPSRPVPEVAAWTGVPQSFMDLRGDGPYDRGGRVSRADVWRLRHELWDVEPQGNAFRNPPMSPRPPFGSIGLDELELCLRVHVACGRHDWVYVKWTWLGGSTTAVEPTAKLSGGSCARSVLPRPLDAAWSPPPQYNWKGPATEKAAGDSFRWAATEMEPSGEAIYAHSCVDALVDLGMGLVDGDGVDEDSDTSDKSTAERRLQEWLHTLPLEYEAPSMFP